MSDSKNKEYWSKFADSYDEGVDYIVGKTIQQDLLKMLSEEHDLGEVVEFGCGTGYFTTVIAKSAEQVIATDISNEMLEVAKIKLKDFQNITIKKIDCEDSRLPSNKFDTILMANVIHFIKAPNIALQECYRILKTGGLLILVDYTGYSMKWSDKMKLGLRFFRRCGIPPRHFKTSLSPDEFCFIVKKSGFDIEKIQVIGNQTKALYLKGRKK